MIVIKIIFKSLIFFLNIFRNELKFINILQSKKEKPIIKLKEPLLFKMSKRRTNNNFRIKQQSEYPTLNFSKYIFK